MNKYEITPPYHLSESDLAPKDAPFGLVSDAGVLVAIAHPDDEFLIGDAIIAAQEADARVHALVATLGRASLLGDRDVARSGGRREEALNALGAYGIPEQSVTFLDLPDGELHRRNVMAELSRQVLEASFASSADIIITTGPTGYGHSDHRSVHQAAVIAGALHHNFGKAPPEVWGLTERPGDENFFADIERRLDALQYHRSQFQLQPHDSTAPEGWITAYGYDFSPETYRLLRRSYGGNGAADDLFIASSFNREIPTRQPGGLNDILGMNDTYTTYEEETMLTEDLIRNAAAP